MTGSGRLCPEGHESAAIDYCDTCGSPMAASAPPAAPRDAGPPVAPPGPVESGTGGVQAGGLGEQAVETTQTCPHCAATNRGSDLFCEVCGFDFTTGVMPRPAGGEPSFLDLPPMLSESEPPEPGEGSDTPRPTPGTEPGHTATSSEPGEHRGGPDTGRDPAPAAAPDGDTDEADTGDAAETPDEGREGLGATGTAAGETPDQDRGRDAEPKTEKRAESSLDLPESGPVTPTPRAPDTVGAPAAEAAPRGSKPVHRPPSREVAGDWVVEVWIDPDWFAVQDTDEVCPSAAPPEVVRITGSDALVGRRSRTSVPDVDCGVDTAVSRRQALLTSDGRRWWIEDLDSSNGTWVAPAIGPLPTEPITGRREIDADDRVYVGAWTRLVLRPATSAEVSGHG